MTDDSHLSTHHPGSKDPPLPELLEHLWTLERNGRRLRCGLYGNPFGVEVRVSYSEEEILITQLLKYTDQARQWAEDYRRMLVGTGKFTEAAT